MNVYEFQNQIFEEINNPQNQIYLKIRKDEINKEEYLSEIQKRGKSAGLTEAEIEDVCFLVDKTLWGFGILDYLINEDDEISDIRLIDKDSIRVKRLGKREETGLFFASEAEYCEYIQFITNRNEVNVSASNAAQVFTDKKSSPTNILRFSLVSSLLNSNGQTTLLIRKIPKEKKTFDTLLKEKFLTEKQRDYIEKLWKKGESILVCGPNGSGKTTLTNAILESTPKEKSAVVIQESEELFCKTHPEMIFRKILPPRNHASFYYDLKALGTLALMESFDIIVVGEIKGGEAANLAYATYTGSQCMTTVHSNSASEGLDKIIDYALAEEKNRTREHFAKQLKSLRNIIYVEDYKIKEIVRAEYDTGTAEYTFQAIDL